MIKDNDPGMEEAGKWWEKLSNPLSATFRIVQARFRGIPPSFVDREFNPEELLEQYRVTGAERMKRLAEATKENRIFMGDFITQEAVDQVTGEVLKHDFRKGK